MKNLFLKFALCTLIFVLLSASKCSEERKLTKNLPSQIEQVYYQKWVGGVEGAGTGTNVFVVVNDENFVLDSLYYKNEQQKLIKGNNLTWSANFRDKPLKDITMSGNSKDEYGNQLPSVTKQIPFELEKNECIVSYFKKNERIYVKITNMINKGTIAFPSASNKSD